jgi:hypothetical protein
MAIRSYSRRIEVRVPSRDFAAGVQSALERLGYELVPATRGGRPPDIRIVAGSRLRRLSSDLTEPVILFGGNPEHDDSRVVGHLKRPVRIRELFALLQRTLETHPRAVPRIPTALPARSLRDGAGSPGAIVSLSEGGCCLRNAELLPGDGRLRIEFALPGAGSVNTWARPCYRSNDQTGLMFDRLRADSRMAISRFVEQSLTGY